MSTTPLREALDALKAALRNPDAPSLIQTAWAKVETEAAAIEEELVATREAILGAGGWKDVLTVETILHDRARADLKKARQEIGRLTDVPSPPVTT